jgi:hypothetical protein
MKKLYPLFFLAFVILFLAATNPSTEDHRQKVSEKVMDDVSGKSEADGNSWQQLGKEIGRRIGGALIEKVISRENYLLFSLGKIEFMGETKYVSLGLAGMVWIFEKSDNRSDSVDSNSEGSLFSSERTGEEKIKEVNSNENLIREMQRRHLSARLVDRDLKLKILFGDLDNDGFEDAIVEWCIKTSDADRDAGGGNAMMFFNCLEEGFTVYQGLRNGFRLMADHDKSEFSDDGFIYSAEKIEDGKIFCFTSDYADGDPRCCPSLKRTIYLLFSGNTVTRPYQSPVIESSN